MVHLLAKIFLKDRRGDYKNPEVRLEYGQICAALGISLNIALFAAKYIAGFLTASIAITADAFNNLSDAGSSVISLMGFKIAGRKADREHPFGHGLAENVVGLIIAVIIMMMGLDLAKTSVKKIISPEEIRFSALSLWILGISILIKLYMGFYNYAIGRKIGSSTLRATMTDSLSDAIATCAVLISLLIGRFTGVNIDGWTGALVAIIILWGAYSAAKDAISPLLGCAPSHELVQKIEDIVHEYPEVIGMHDLIVHEYGAGNLMVSLHAEVSSSGDLVQLHDVIDTIERRLKRDLNCHAVIHMDPVDTDDAAVSEMRARVDAAVKAALGADITIHDFRMVTGPTHTNLIFDAVLPSDSPVTEAEARAKIIDAVRDLGKQFFVVVTIDKAYYSG